MIRATIGIFSQGGVSVDTDYQAVLDYATTQGYTLPSAGQQALQNQLVVDLKDAGIWSKLDTFGVFATDGDSDFALIDWKRVSDYTAVNSPTFTTNEGFIGNGTSAYIDTNNSLDSGSNFDPSTSTGSFGGWKYAQGAGAVFMGGDRAENRIRTGTGYLMGASISSMGSSLGFYHVNSDGTNGVFYINGTSFRTWTPGSDTDAFNFTGLKDTQIYSADTMSMIFSGGDISTEQSDFYTSVNSYMTSI